MTEEIKSRIEQIRAGRVPEGYKQVHSGTIPVDWNEATISNIADEITDMAGEGEYETLSISAGIGFVNQAQKFGREKSGAQYAKYAVLHRGDFSYNKGNSNLYPQGCIYRLNDRKEAAVPNVFESFRFTAQDGDYYEQLFVNGFLNKQLYSKINHGVRDDGLLNLTGSDFYSCCLPVPPLPEQKKIAEILRQCDKVIELKKANVEEEKKRKKWMLGKLLSPPKSNNKTYERDGWKKVCINEIGSVITGSTPQTSKAEFFENGIYPWVTPTDISSKYISETERKLSKVGINVSKKLPANTLLVTCIASIGKNTILRSEGSCNQQINALIMNPGFDTEFIYYAISNQKQYFLKLAGTTATPIINAAIFGKMQFDVPNYPLQKAIAQVLAMQDKCIDLLDQEIFQWQQKKKALMQLLLMGIVRVK